MHILLRTCFCAVVVYFGAIIFWRAAGTMHADRYAYTPPGKCWVFLFIRSMLHGNKCARFLSKTLMYPKSLTENELNSLYICQQNYYFLWHWLFMISLCLFIIPLFSSQCSFEGRAGVGSVSVVLFHWSCHCYSGLNACIVTGREYWPQYGH